MTEQIRLQFKIASLLLQFPDERLAASLDSIEEAARVLPEEKPRQVFEAVLASMRKAALIELQEDYTRVFDLNPATSLNLTYHRWGNEKKRGQALVWMGSLYRAAGYERSCGELPDFLPMVLELLSVAPEETCTELLDRLGGEIKSLASRLKETQTVYAPLLDALDGIGQARS